MTLDEILEATKNPGQLQRGSLPEMRAALDAAFGTLERTGSDKPEIIRAMSKIADAAEVVALAAGERTSLAASTTPPRGEVSSMITRMAAANKAKPSPSSRAYNASPVVITAACPGPGVVAGQQLTSEIELAQVMTRALENMRPWRGEPPVERRRMVAHAEWSYPEDRRLGSDPESNTRKIDAVCGLAAGRYDRSGALVATGGICLPVNVDYSVPTWSTSERPLRDGLPSFQANRGGVRFVTPPDIGVPTLQGGTASGAGTSVDVWTEATDASPGGATKPVWVVGCGTEQLVYVNAIATRVQFGNMQSRFAPEQVAANTQQAIAISAREAELELLTQMYDQSKQVRPEQYLGATRDLLSSVDLLMAQYRHSHRIPRSASFTAVFPDWAMDLIRADLARELAHDNAGAADVLAISDAQIENYFSTRGVNVIWTLDGLQAGSYGTGGHAITNQYFPIATAGDEPQWPGQSSDAAFMVAWLLFVEGTFQFLDGGGLDLGVVRDSVLDATNDYETFVEVFEATAFRGLEVYQVQSMVLPNGGSAGSVVTSGYHE